jgi:hypothetical protein
MDTVRIVASRSFEGRLGGLSSVCERISFFSTHAEIEIVLRVKRL